MATAHAPTAPYQAQVFQSQRKKGPPRWRWRVVDLNDLDENGTPRTVCSSPAGWSEKAGAEKNLEESALALDCAVLRPLRQHASGPTTPRRGLLGRLLSRTPSS